MPAISFTILLNAVDVTAQQTGRINVSITEGSARLATFKINPPAGAVDPYSYIGQTVSIDYGATRLFTGIVNTPVYDIATGLLTLSCSDVLQEVFELTTRAAIDLALPGYWDGTVFTDPADNWTYAQQIMSTYPGSYDKSPSGVGRVTDWLPKVTPDATFTESSILDGSLSVSLANRRSITNSVKISIDHRYKRLWQREVNGTWNPGFTAANWDTYLANTFAWPTKKMVEEACSGWTIKSIAYTDTPPTGVYGTPPAVWQQTDYTLTLCITATIDIAQRWIQDVTDTYTITVASAASVAQHGLLEIEQNHGITETDNGQFLEFSAYKAPQGTNIEAGNWLDYTSTDPSTALLTAINLAKTKILDSHRQNSVTFRCALDPALDVSSTVRVNTAKTQATGKVSAISHSIDVSEGRAEAITECTIAVYLPNIAAQTDDAITAPASPHVTPSGLTNSLPVLSTHIGGADALPADDPNWNGWVTNYDIHTGSAPVVYDPRFSFEIAAITEGNSVAFAGVSAFNVAIPQNEMVMTK